MGRLQIGAVLLGIGVSVLPCRAATVELKLTERDGPVLADLSVRLRTSGSGSMWRPSQRGRTDGAGKLTFEKVAPGTYTFQIDLPPAMDLVPPDQNPFARTPVITLANDSDKLDVDLELWRGVRVVAQVAVDRGEPPRTGVRFRSLESDLELTPHTDPTGYVERVLVPGRWNVSVEPPQGYVLADFEVNGHSRDGHDTVLDLKDMPQTTHVTWHYSAPAMVYGRITVDGDNRGPLKIVALLTEPGPWFERVVARGGSRFDQVTARWVAKDEYEMVLPDGRWLIRPEGERLEEADPPEVELQLEPGDEQRVDFTVRHGAREPGMIAVTVSGEGRPRLARALVEIWTLDEDARPVERLHRKKTSRWGGPVYFRGMEAGDYLVVAGHADYLEGREELLDYEPSDEPRRVGVGLRKGAEVTGRALDEEDVRVPDVALKLTRLGEPPELLIEDAGFLAAKIQPEATTDTTGFAKLTGLYPGGYEVTARMEGELAARRFVRVALDEDPEDSLALELAAGDEIELRLAVLPAASVSASLVCRDGGSLPGATSVRVFPVDVAEPSRREDPEMLADALLALDDLALGGRYLDSFLAGPLEEDAMHVAVRPSGYGLWTWALGTEVRERALVLNVDTGSTTELGFLEIECGPAVEVLPVVQDGLPLPDLTEALLQARATPLLDNPEREFAEPRIEPHRDSVLLRDLPEGEVLVEIVATHPHFLPTEELSWTFEVELERGWVVDRSPVIESIGGAVVVKTEVVVRLRDSDNTSHDGTVVENESRFHSLPAGSYRLERCLDVECTESELQGHPFEVEVGQTSRHAVD